MLQLSARVENLNPSTTLAIASRTRELKSMGQDVIDLGVGEPDFNTPDHIIQAAKNAMDEGKTRYTPAGGIAELKKAIIDKLDRDNQLSYNADQVTVTTGAKQALYNVFQALLNPHDEVIVLSPYWVSYMEQIKLAGGKPVVVSCLESDNFKATPQKITDAITPKTRALLINSPSNPTGAMYTKEELIKIGDICIDHNLIIISDEIYEQLVYDNKHVSIASLSNDLYRRTVVINGVSKTYAMTGWRIGYAAGNSKIIKAMTNIASHSTSNPTSIAQYAAVAALNGSDESVQEMISAFKDRREYVLQSIQQSSLLTCKKPLGAFYVYVNISKALEEGGYPNADSWATDLLNKNLVAVIPGSAFGSDCHIRISFAASMSQLKEGISRIHAFTSSHEPGQQLSPEL